MPPSSNRWTVREDAGTFSLDLGGAPPQEFKAGSSWRLGLSGPEVAFLMQEGAGEGTGFFAGTLGALSLGEVFGHLLAGVRSGRLLIGSPGAQRQVVLRDGQVIFATSTEHHERLGCAVVKLGLLTADEVEEALLAVKPGERLGLILTRSELLSSAQVYAAMSFLVREIVVNLFELTAGEFLFLEMDPPQGDAVKLAERTRDLVLEGIRRSEEVLRLRRKWPDTLTLQTSGKEPPAEIDAELLWHAVGDGVTISSLRRSWEGGEYSFLTQLEAMLERGALLVQREREVAAVSPLPPQGPVLQMYQDFIQRVAQALLGQGLGLTSLRAYLQEPGPKLKPLFEGVHLVDDGLLDVQRIAANIGDSGEAVDRARTYEALDALVAYALFSAQNALPAGEFDSLREHAAAMRGPS